MNWLLKRLGYRDREYRGNDFCILIKPIQREAISVIHTRNSTHLTFDGQWIGQKWEGIEVHIPHEVEAGQAYRVAAELEIAFQALGYSYVIARLGEVEIVSETERQTAIEELTKMGYEIEVSPDRKQIRQKLRTGAPRTDIQTVQAQAPRMMTLLQAAYGKRQNLEIVAKSKDF
jgi:hypothetical protein